MGGDFCRDRTALIVVFFEQERGARFPRELSLPADNRWSRELITREAAEELLEACLEPLIGLSRGWGTVAPLETLKAVVA